MTEPIDAALYYAGKGLRVFACQPGRKLPFGGGHGCKDATTDRDTISKWWTEVPDANVAIATGDGLIVLDIDTKNGNDGWGTLDALMRDHGELPGTRGVTTPTGGCHLYFRAPKDAGIRNSASKHGPGLDVRGCGGYVLAPPSIVDGKPYVWTWSSPTAELPGAWVELLQDKPEPFSVVGCSSLPRARSARCAYLKAALEDERDKLLRAPEGTRNHQLNAYGFSLGQLVHLGLRADDIVASAEWAMSQWTWTHGRRDRHKDATTLDRAIREGMSKPREVANV